MLHINAQGYCCNHPAAASCFLSYAADILVGMRKECTRTEQEHSEKYIIISKLFKNLKSTNNINTELIQQYCERSGACLSSFQHHVRASFSFFQHCVRANFSALQHHAMASFSALQHRVRASLTIEAAIALPLFIFMMLLLLFPIKVMEDERRIQNTAEHVGRQLASEQYVKSVGSELLNKDGDGSELLGGIISGAEEGISLGVILAKALEMKSVEAPYFSEATSVFSEESKDMFKVELKYNIRLPFSAYIIPAPSRTLIVNRRAWTGSAGGRGRSKYGDECEEDTDEDDRIVYLGKTSTVYHDDPNCHYLSNVMKTADASHIDALRNESGGKYHACPSCKPGTSGTVYYFESGTAYHSSEHCKAITAYSRSVHLSEVHDMKACSYCGRKE